MNDDNKRITDKWLSTVMTPNRHYRDYYINGKHGRLTIRLCAGKSPQVMIERTVICEIKTRGQVRRLVEALGLKLQEPAL